MTDKEFMESLESEDKILKAPINPDTFVEKSVFDVLNSANVNDHTEGVESDNGKTLTYLSWTWAWAEVKKRYPEANYEIEKFDGLPYAYDELTGYMVYTKVTIKGITHEMWLPVMDSKNKAMKAIPYTYRVKNKNFKYAKKNKDDGKYYDSYGNEQTEFIDKTVEAATMFDINKTIMRCLTKNLAMFGLGLYIYAGEDLPEVEKEERKKTSEQETVEELRELYKQTSGKDFDKWVEQCGGITPATYPVMKAKLQKQITDNAEKGEKK